VGPAPAPAPPRTPVAHDAWELVDVDIDDKGDRLVWRYPRKRQLITAPARASLLDEFVRLVSKSSETILKFAKRYGPLLLCEKHNWPATHATATYCESENRTDENEGHHAGHESLVPLVGMSPEEARRRAFRDGCQLRLTDDGHSWWEPIEGWRHYSREARALLRVATNVRNKKLVPLDEWKILLTGKTDNKFDPARVPSHASARDAVVYSVNEWLDLGRVGPVLAWWTAAPEVTFGRRSLFSALALQLMATIGRHGLATCDACGRPYFVRRRPARGRRNFCDDKACKREAWRLAKRDQYERAATR